MLKSFIKSALHKAGLDIIRYQPHHIQQANSPILKHDTMHGGLLRLQQAGIEVHTVFDVGAAQGSWSNICEQSYPDANYLLVEANVAHKTNLDRYCQQHHNAEYILAAAGSQDGDIYFDTSTLLGGHASKVNDSGSLVKVPQVRLDQVADSHKLRGPYLIKLDTHGFEVPILEGATGLLSHTNAMVIEAYNFQQGDGPLFYELTDYLLNHGFRLYDIVDIMRRPGDRVLWQIDMFFIRSDHPIFSKASYE